MSEKAKKGFKMPSSYTVLLIIIAIMAVLTWFIPAGGLYRRYLQGSASKSTRDLGCPHGTDSGYARYSSRGRFAH